MASEELGAQRVIRGIYRYPIKGLSPQPLRGVELEAGRPFPFDRVFALVRPNAPVDAEAPRWAKKGLFLMLMLDEELARVQTRLDVETLELSVLRQAEPNGAAGPEQEPVLSADLKTRAGRAAVEVFFREHLPKLQAAPKLVHAPAGHFMDKPDNVLSCINLATLRSLEAEWGVNLHPLRFRANFYIDGARPWEELEWVGSEIQLGDVSCRVDRKNGRCGATNVNPLTGERDMDIPGELRKRFGHKDLGVYLVACSSGRVVVGDDVRISHERTLAPRAASLEPPARQRGNFICRGCYYVYEEGKDSEGGVLAAFGDLGADWRCPDCGTTTADFRPYLPALTDSPHASRAEGA
jgi:GntR family transcriptional regulator/MocR family aminotransferase